MFIKCRKDCIINENAIIKICLINMGSEFYWSFLTVDDEEPWVESENFCSEEKAYEWLISTGVNV